MVATVHPAVAHTDESISTCKFAQRVAQIKNEVSVNEVVDHAALIQRLKEENRMLRESGGLADDDGKGTLTPAELRSLHAEVRAFVADADPRALVQWGKTKRAARVRHAMWILKGLLLEGWRPHHAPAAEAWTSGLEQRATRGAEGAADAAGSAADASTSGGGGDAGGGAPAADDADDEARWGAASSARRRARDEQQGGEEARAVSAEDEAEEARRQALLERTADAPPTSSAAVRAEEAAWLAGAEGAYDLFRTRYAQGAALARQIRDAKASLRAEIESAQGVGLSLRAARDAIAALKAQVEARRVSIAVASVLPPPPSSSSSSAPDHGGGYEWHVDGIIEKATGGGSGGGGSGGGSGEERKDEEEVRLCAELQQAKLKYHRLADELKHSKQRCSALQARCDGLYGASEAIFTEWWPLACAALGSGPPPALSSQPPPPATSERHAAEASAQQRQSTPPPPVERGERPREAWSGDRGAANRGAAASERGAPAVVAAGGAAYLAMLEDPEAALAEFRRAHWAAEKAAARDALKRRLHESYAGAKEAGELVARKRASVTELKQRLGEADVTGGVAEDDVARLRSQLQLDTTLYKGAVASLRELKSEIEGLQGELSRSQAVLQRDFQAWHQRALAEARGGGARADAGAAPMRTTSKPQKEPAATARRGGGGGALRDGTNVIDLSVEIS